MVVLTIMKSNIKAAGIVVPIVSGPDKMGRIGADDADADFGSHPARTKSAVKRYASKITESIFPQRAAASAGRREIRGNHIGTLRC
jgi:hypothetical protein